MFYWNLKVDMPILTCIFFTFNWLTLTSEMHFVKFHPVVASCLLSRGKRKYAPLGMRLLWKYIRNYFLVYQLISPFLVYLQNYKEFEAEILDLQSEKYGLSFDIKKYTTSGWAWGMKNVIGIRAFKRNTKLYPKILGNFPMERNSAQGLLNEIWCKAFFCHYLISFLFFGGGGKWCDWQVFFFICENFS